MWCAPTSRAPSHTRCSWPPTWWTTCGTVVVSSASRGPPARTSTSAAHRPRIGCRRWRSASATSSPTSCRSSRPTCTTGTTACSSASTSSRATSVGGRVARSGRRSRRPMSGSRANRSRTGSRSTSRSRTSCSRTPDTTRSDMAEGEIEINGGNVVYEFVGPDDGEVVVITPGGRFSKDFGGVHELAYALADGGKRVLLWDRPNTGKSDIQLYGRSESHMRAETIGLMIRKLGIEKVVAVGGSGGARDSIIFTLMWPDLVRKLAVWHIVGGNYSSIALAGVYIMSELQTVRSRGIEGI